MDWPGNEVPKGVDEKLGVLIQIELL